MSASSSGLLKPTVDSLVSAFQSLGHRLGRAHAHEFIAASLGFWTYQSLLDYGTPLTACTHQEHDPVVQHGRHLRVLTERIERLLKVEPTTAMMMAAVVKRTVGSHALQVDALRVLFEPAFDSHRHAILQALRDRDLPPTRASDAIGAGLVPAPVRMALSDRLSELSPFLGDLFDSDGPVFLWERPSALLMETSVALEDQFRQTTTHRTASLGLNLAIVKKRVWSRPTYPQNQWGVHAFATRYESTSGRGWRTDGHTRGQLIDNDSRARQSLPPLEEFVGKPIERLPRLSWCPKCLAVYSEEVPELRHRCDPEVDAEKLVQVVRSIRDDGLITVSGDAIAARWHALGGRPVSDESLLSHLERHVMTYGMRRLQSGDFAVGSEKLRPSKRSIT